MAGTPVLLRTQLSAPGGRAACLCWPPRSGPRPVARAAAALRWFNPLQQQPTPIAGIGVLLHREGSAWHQQTCQAGCCYWQPLPGSAITEVAVCTQAQGWHVHCMMKAPTCMHQVFCHRMHDAGLTRTAGLTRGVTRGCSSKQGVGAARCHVSHLVCTHAQALWRCGPVRQRLQVRCCSACGQMQADDGAPARCSSRAFRKVGGTKRSIAQCCSRCTRLHTKVST